jgi:hypothetical protein
VTEPTPDQDALSTAQALTSALDGMQAQLKSVNDRQALAEKYGHRNRFYAVLALVFVAFDIISTAVAVIAVTVALHASSRAAEATASAAVSHRIAVAEHDELITGCQASNALKAKQGAVWIYVQAALQPTAAETAAQRASSERFLDGLQQRVRTAYMARNCATAYKAPK